jgi:hypothetical protein
MIGRLIVMGGALRVFGLGVVLPPASASMDIPPCRNTDTSSQWNLVSQQQPPVSYSRTRLGQSGMLNACFAGEEKVTHAESAQL